MESCNAIQQPNQIVILLKCKHGKGLWEHQEVWLLYLRIKGVLDFTVRIHFSGGRNEILYYKGHSEKKNVTKVSTSREDQIIRNIFFSTKMIDCKNGKKENMADRKGNRDKRKIKQEGNTSESVEIIKETLGNESETYFLT